MFNPKIGQLTNEDIKFINRHVHIMPKVDQKIIDGLNEAADFFFGKLLKQKYNSKNNTITDGK